MNTAQMGVTYLPDGSNHTPSYNQTPPCFYPGTVPLQTNNMSVPYQFGPVSWPQGTVYPSSTTPVQVSQGSSLQPHVNPTKPLNG